METLGYDHTNSDKSVIDFERKQFNSSSPYHFASQHSSYASQFPYQSTINEHFLSNLINMTLMNKDKINKHYTPNSSDHNSNNSLNNAGCTDSYDMGLFNSGFQIVLHIMYITIFIIGVFGNFLVFYVFQSSPRMKTVTNFFIINLAVSDMLMSLFCIPFSFISLFVLQYWPVGEGLCKMVNYIQVILRVNDNWTFSIYQISQT